MDKLQTMFTILGDRLIPETFARSETVSPLLIELTILLHLLRFLEGSFILFIKLKTAKRKVFILNFIKPGVVIIDDLDTFEFEEKDFCEMDVVECVGFLNPVLYRLRGSRRGVIVIESVFRWSERLNGREGRGMCRLTTRSDEGDGTGRGWRIELSLVVRMFSEYGSGWDCP